MSSLLVGLSGYIARSIAANHEPASFVAMALNDFIDSSMGEMSAFAKFDRVIVASGVTGHGFSILNAKSYRRCLRKVISLLDKYLGTKPIFLISSIQALNDNDYGQHKRLVESDFLTHIQNGRVIRLPNMFGINLYNMSGKCFDPIINKLLATAARGEGCEQIICDRHAMIDMVHVDILTANQFDALSKMIKRTITISSGYKWNVYSIARYIDDLANEVRNGNSIARRKIELSDSNLVDAANQIEKLKSNYAAIITNRTGFSKVYSP